MYNALVFKITSKSEFEVFFGIVHSKDLGFSMKLGLNHVIELLKYFPDCQLFSH